MSEYEGIIVNLDRCVGCYACEVACRKENNLAEGESWIKVDQIGPYPVDERLRMDFDLKITQECTLCRDRLKKRQQPFCVSVCPTDALSYCRTYELLNNIKRSRIQVLLIEEKARS